MLTSGGFVRQAARFWFLPALVLLLAGGITLGVVLPEPRLKAVAGWIEPAWTTAVVLFLMSFTLDSEAVRQASFRRPLPALWGAAVNLVAGPLLAWGLAAWQLLPDFRFGLLIAGSVPCTLATASVWARKARGNDAVVMVVTIVTNLIAFAITPLWLEAATGRSVPLDVRKMALRLFFSAVVPMVLGWLARRSDPGEQLAARHTRSLGVLAQGLVLLVVFGAACDAGARIADTGRPPDAWPLAVAWASCVAVHVALLTLAVAGGRWMGFDRRDVVAVAFAGSQKTLPIGLVIATDPATFANPNLLGPGEGAPFVLFPMILFHLSQLVIDSVLAAHWAKSAEQQALAERRPQ